MRKIKYTCKKCGWHTSIWEEWEDLKPARCMNKKCNTSFRVDPSSLVIEKPVKAKPVSAQQEQSQHNKKEKRHGSKKHNKE